MKTTLAITLCLSVGLCPNSQSASPPQFQIADRALATLKVPGFPDFLAADGNAVWVTNENRVEKLVFESKRAVMTVHVPEPCGAMIVAFNSLWVASCRDKSLYRVNKHSGEIVGRIATGLADPAGELSIAAGAGSIWLMSDEGGVLSRVDPTTNRVTKTIHVKPYSYAAVFGFGRVWITNTASRSPHAFRSNHRHWHSRTCGNW